MPVQAIDSDFIRLVLNFDVFCFHYCNVAKLGKYQDFSEIFPSFFIIPWPESLVNSILDFFTQTRCPFMDQPGLPNAKPLCRIYTVLLLLLHNDENYNLL